MDVQETNDKSKRAVQSKDEQLAAKDKEITRTAARINEQDLEIQSLKRQIATLDEENHKKDLEIRSLNGQLTGNSDEIQELKKRLAAKYVAEIEELKALHDGLYASKACDSDSMEALRQRASGLAPLNLPVRFCPSLC